MSDFSVLESGRSRRPVLEARRRRNQRRRGGLALIITLAIGLLVLLTVMVSGLGEPAAPRSQDRPASIVAPRSPQHAAFSLRSGGTQLHVRLKLKLRSGLLFDVRTGRVLWARDPTARLRIASLTKMMTALVVVAHARASDQVLITPAAKRFSGSGVGLLPLGRRVPLLALLYGLLLPSGNDAAVALAQHVAGSPAGLITLMNARARAMGLGCSHFNSVSGIVDQDNYSCAQDLAVLAHAVLRDRLLARIVASPSAALPFPIRGGKLYLYNNNPLLRLRYPGVDGVKTGYTVASGPCLVAAARRGRRWFGVVLLNSGNPSAQAQALLNAAFARVH